MKHCNSSTGQSSLTLITRLPSHGSAVPRPTHRERLDDRPRAGCSRNCEASPASRNLGQGGRDRALEWRFALAYVIHELDDGAAFVDRALTLNPNLAVAWHYGRLVRIWLGDPEVARPRFGHAMRPSPFDPIIGAVRTGVAYSHFFAGRYDDAISMAKEALRDTPNFIPA